MSLGGEITPTIIPSLLKTQEDENAQRDLENNITLLSGLSLEENGSVFYISDLIEAGFLFGTFTNRYQLPNTADSFCLEYSFFQLYLTEPDTVLIYKKSNQL